MRSNKGLGSGISRPRPAGRKQSCRVAMRLAPALLSLVLCSPAFAINGASMAYRSSGAASGSDWTLSENGYVGTYIKLDAPGDVTVSAGLGSGRRRRRPEYEYRDRRYDGGLRCDIRL